MPQLQRDIMGNPAVFKRTNFTPYKWTWGQINGGHQVQFRVIHWNRDGTSERLPRRDPKTHPKEASPLSSDQVYCAQRDRDTQSVDVDSVPLKSRYEQRLASKKKSQESYGRRRWQQHGDWVRSQLECHKMNEKHQNKSLSPRYPLTGLVVQKSDHWYKTKKMGTNPPNWRPKAIRAHRRKDRAGRKQKASQHDNDYRVKRGREISGARQRQERKHS